MANGSDTHAYPAGIKLVHEIEQDGYVFTNVEWSPTGEILASGSESYKYLLWNPEKNISTWPATGAFGGARTVSWSPKGERIAIGCYDGTIRVQPVNAKNKNFEEGLLNETNEEIGFWRWENLLQLNLVGRYANANSILAIDWIAEPDRLVTAHSTGEVILWDLATGRMLSKFEVHITTERSPFMAVNQSHSAIAACGLKTVHIWNLRTLANDHFHIENLSAYGPDCIGWSPDEKCLAVGTLSGHILVIDCASMNLDRTIKPKQGSLDQVRFSADGRCLAATDKDCLSMWSTSDWKEYINVNFEGENLRGGLAFHPTKKLLAVGVNGGKKIKILEFSRSIFP